MFRVFTPFSRLLGLKVFLGGVSGRPGGCLELHCSLGLWSHTSFSLLIIWSKGVLLLLADATCVRSNHLFHYLYVMGPWDTVRGLFGLPWVMPSFLRALFACWLGGIGWHLVVWRAVLYCLLWSLWWERNVCVFDDWIYASGRFRFSFTLDVVNGCSFWAGYNFALCKICLL